MKPVNAREARQAATRKGFVDGGGDHYYLHYHHQGKRTAWRIKISRGADEYKPSHIRADARVCGEMPAGDLLKVLTCEHDERWMAARYEEYTRRQR